MAFGFRARVSVIAAVAVLAAGCGAKSIDTKNLSPQAAAGAKFVSTNCMGCHSVSGADGQGPTFKGLAGSQVTFTDRTIATADDAYLTQAIVDPDAKIVKGYHQGIMSSVYPKGKVSAEEAAQIVAYLDTVKK